MEQAVLAVNGLPGQKSLAFAYGSSVFTQGSAAGKAGMLDLVLAVQDPEAWFEKALNERPQDFPWLVSAICSPQQIARFQQSGGGKMWFNTDVSIAGVENKIKYGIISTDDLVQDLNTWDNLYVCGRLHKPVQFLIKPDAGQAMSGGDNINAALQSNLRHAVHTALIALPEEFTEVDLYKCISNFSYAGDVRMKFAEDPRKVDNIVGNNLYHFRSLYERVLSGRDPNFLGQVERREEEGGLIRFGQNLDSGTRRRIWQAHPLCPKLLPWNAVENSIDKQRDVMAQTLARVVSKSSRVQSIKGLVTAGPGSAVKYVMRKLGKRFHLL